MNSGRVVLVALLAVLGAVLAVGPATASPSPATPDLADAPLQTSEPENSTNTTLGTEISAFMQTNADKTEGSVDTGMWVASFNGTKNQSRRAVLVARRTTNLEQKYRDLQQRTEALRAARRAGNISELRYRSRIGGLQGQLAALRDAVNTTAPLAKQTGANTESLAQLQRQTANASRSGLPAANVPATLGTPASHRAAGRNANGTGQGPPNDLATANGKPQANQSANGNGNGGNAARISNPRGNTSVQIPSTWKRPVAPSVDPST